MAKKLKTGLKKQGEKLHLFEKERPAELAGPITHICSNREVAVDGCRGVIDYYENRIRLRLTNGEVVFCGTNLLIVELTDCSALIRGIIDTVEFTMR